MHVVIRRALRSIRPPVIAFLVSLPACALGAAHVPRPAPPPADLTLPPDIVFARVVRADSAVVFSHVTHVEYESYRCTGCHPAPFHMLEPTGRVTHQDMDHGGSCGRCHDGKHAFDVRATESCASCHTGRRAAAADTTAGHKSGAFQGPKPFAFRTGSGSPGPVTFRHATHLGRAMTCRTCHPKPFAMKGTAPLPDGAMHEPSACGMCHDGKQAFSVEDDARCVRCHSDGKGGK